MLDALRPRVEVGEHLGFDVEQRCDPAHRVTRDHRVVDAAGRAGTGRKLKSGLTICIEPMINMGSASVTTDGDQWTIRTADGTPSAHYEHMIAVRGGEAEVLTTFKYIEEVLGTTPYQEAPVGAS